MKPFNKTEYNKLCAEFLGWTYYGWNNPLHNSSISKQGYWVNEKSISIKLSDRIRKNPLIFDFDWNWIMEVVEKIEKELPNIYFQIEDNECYVFDISKFDDTQMFPIIMSDIGNSKKEAVVQAIWEFLQWYENNKNT